MDSLENIRFNHCSSVQGSCLFGGCQALLITFPHSVLVWGQFLLLKSRGNWIFLREISRPGKYDGCENTTISRRCTPTTFTFLLLRITAISFVLGDSLLNYISSGLTFHKLSKPLFYYLGPSTLRKWRLFASFETYKDLLRTILWNNFTVFKITRIL